MKLDVAGRELLNYSEGNRLISHRKMTKKNRPNQSRQKRPKMKSDDHSKQSVGQAPAPCGRHKLKRPAQVTQGQLTQKHKTCDASRSLVGVQHNLLQGLGVCQRRITPALALRKLEVVYCS